MIASGLRYRVVVRRFFRVKTQRFGASNGGTYGCRDPPGGVAAVTFPVSGLRVKTLDHSGLDDGGVSRRQPLGGVVVELRCFSVSLRYHRWAS